jgi:hypothetical protein
MVYQAVEAIEDVKKKIDFATIVNMVNENQARIKYAVDVAYDIHVTPIP